MKGEWIAGWRNLWFRERPVIDFAIARIVLVGLVLYLNSGGRFLRVALAAPEHWAPIPLLQVLGLPQPGSEQLVLLDLLTRAVLLTALLGFATRSSLAAAFALELVQEAYLNSLGKVTHATLPMLYGLLLLALSPCGGRLSLDAAIRTWRRKRPLADRTAAWPLELLFAEVALFYFQAGCSKLWASGFAWADGYTLQFYLLQKQQPAGLWLAEHLALCSLLSWGVLLLELGFPLAIFARRLRPAFLAGGLLFHLGTAKFMSIGFWPLWSIYLLFVPWSALWKTGTGTISAARKMVPVPVFIPSGRRRARAGSRRAGPAPRRRSACGDGES